MGLCFLFSYSSDVICQQFAQRLLSVPRKKMINDLVDACTCLYTSENNGCECSKYAACLN